MGKNTKPIVGKEYRSETQEATVVKVTKDAVWYTCPQWNGWQNCARHTWDQWVAEYVR